MSRYSRREPMCRNCYERGHTMRSCPKLSDYQKKVYQDINKNRACKHCTRNGYPDGVGHNIRGCKKRIEDREYYIRDVIEYRKMIINLLEKHQIGIGTIVNHEIPRWGRWGAKQDLENDILVIKEFVMPTCIERPSFKANSTITNEEEIVYPFVQGMAQDIQLPSSSPRRSPYDINLFGRYSRKSEVLTPCIPGVKMVESLAEIENICNINFPNYLE